MVRLKARSVVTGSPAFAGDDTYGTHVVMAANSLNAIRMPRASDDIRPDATFDGTP
jgi:hypothetical protein